MPALRLLVQRNLEDAARAVGISPKTLLRWMKEPEFDTAYRSSAQGRVRASYRAAAARRVCRSHHPAEDDD
jgi:hypothetical protein